MEDCLIIGVDISKGKSISCMTVARKNGDEMQVINQFFDKEAEDLYYKIINIHAKTSFPVIKKEAINRGMSNLQNIYSQKELLEVIDLTEKLKSYTTKEREHILNYNTPKKIREILAAFWLTHTNGEFFNYFGFNWIPPFEIRELATQKLNKYSNKNIEELFVPTLSRKDIGSIILTKEALQDIEKNIDISCMIEPKIFLKGATNE